MRKLLLATAIATLTAAPVLAQQGLAPAPNQPYANSWTNAYGPQWEQRGWSHSRVRYGATVQADPAYAYAAPQYHYGAVSGPYAAVDVDAGPYAMTGFGFATSPAAVSVDGRYLGNDPDPFIRHSLIRDQDEILGRGPN